MEIYKYFTRAYKGKKISFRQNKDTGEVDIQLDENTYKSSYDILLEISKVWNELNDLSRPSLLEQLFGERQANVGAAILENGELLQQVYETAENSIGSATKEQER
jgi:hypothetical protein